LRLHRSVTPHVYPSFHNRLSFAFDGLCAAPRHAPFDQWQGYVVEPPQYRSPEVLFRMFADGSGQANFMNNPSGPQDIHWTLDGQILCIETDARLLSSFDCARLTIDGPALTLARLASDSVVTGVLIAR
jgi:hypothetical protein